MATIYLFDTSTWYLVMAICWGLPGLALLVEFLVLRRPASDHVRTGILFYVLVAGAYLASSPSDSFATPLLFATLVAGPILGTLMLLRMKKPRPNAFGFPVLTPPPKPQIKWPEFIHPRPSGEVYLDTAGRAISVPAILELYALGLPVARIAEKLHVRKDLIETVIGFYEQHRAVLDRYFDDLGKRPPVAPLGTTERIFLEQRRRRRWVLFRDGTSGF